MLHNESPFASGCYCLSEREKIKNEAAFNLALARHLVVFAVVTVPFSKEMG